MNVHRAVAGALRSGASTVALLTVLAQATPLQAGVAYDNLGGDGSVYFAGQGGHEALDDLHGIESGDLSQVTFRYFNPDPAGFGAFVTVYSNPGGLDAGAQVVAGPIYVDALVSGTMGTAVVLFPGAETVSEDCWVGVRFTSDQAGLVISESPTVGTSHDLYREGGNLFYFGGSPLANFSIRVEVGANVDVSSANPGESWLSAPWPNPMRSETSFQMSLPRATSVSVKVFDTRGALIAVLEEGWREAGVHAIVWNGDGTDGHRVPSGMYFVRMQTTSGTTTRRILKLN